jgi:hypothetical protein
MSRYNSARCHVTSLYVALGARLLVSLLISWAFFAIKTRKNISAAAHDEYIALCNSLFRSQRKDCPPRERGRRNMRYKLFRIDNLDLDDDADFMQIKLAQSVTRDVREVTNIEQVVYCVDVGRRVQEPHRVPLMTESPNSK